MIVVRQKRSFARVCINYYTAESDACMRQCCGPQRGFTMHITDNFGQVSNASYYCPR